MPDSINNTKVDLGSEFIQVFIDRRIALQITTETLAEEIGVGERLVPYWESRERLPRVFNLLCWAEALGMELVLKEKYNGEEVQRQRRKGRTPNS